GFSMTIRLSGAPAAVLKFLGADSRNINDAKLSFTVSETAKLIGGLNAFFKNLRNQKESNLRERNLRESDLRELRNLSERDERDLRELRRLRENSNSCGTAYLFINVIKVVMILAILTLLAFIFMMIAEKKNGMLIGQIGLALSFLMSVSFFIFVWWASLASGNFVKISSTLWIYLTIAFSAIGLALITLRKNLISGE
ncbi:MAG: hypothetical protein FWE89_04735, partial [Syntrophaceae bacterium]|nr:hypothetical protein [Syntrophaceae bacterium]